MTYWNNILYVYVIEMVIEFVHYIFHFFKLKLTLHEKNNSILQFKCKINVIRDEGQFSSNPDNTTGFRMNMCVGSWFRCNNASNTTFGIDFDGANLLADIAGNTTSNHLNNLHYQYNGITSQQVNRGNDFGGPNQSNFGAKHEDDNLIQVKKKAPWFVEKGSFEDTNTDPANWFNKSNSKIYTCGNESITSCTTDDIGKLFNCIYTDVERSIANGTMFNSSINDTYVKYNAEVQLFEVLTEDINAYSYLLDIHTLNEGIYLLKINTENKSTEIRKFVKH